MFRKIDPQTLDEKIFTLIDKDWMLIAAGQGNDFNTMTASWGGLGTLWHEPVAFIFIRPQRHTFLFTEKYSQFTLNFLEPGNRKILSYCGTFSGRDVNKIKKTGLVPLETEQGNIFFEQSRLIIECEKLYFHDLEPENFLSDIPHSMYPEKDYHRMYIGKVINCMIKD